MPLVPSYIQNLSNYVQGKPIEELKRDLGLDHVDKLASNENSLGPSPKAIKAIQASMTNLHRYPDATGYELRTKLADRFNIKMDNVILGAGSEGVMSTIIRTFLLSDDELEFAGIDKALIRLSVGIEAVDDLIDDMSQALDAI